MILRQVLASECTPSLPSGLKALEYRGYDSAGLAVLSQSGALVRARGKGRVAELNKSVMIVFRRCGIYKTFIRSL